MSSPLLAIYGVLAVVVNVRIINGIVITRGRVPLDTISTIVITLEILSRNIVGVVLETDALIRIVVITSAVERTVPRSIETDAVDGCQGDIQPDKVAIIGIQHSDGVIGSIPKVYVFKIYPIYVDD